MRKASPPAALALLAALALMSCASRPAAPVADVPVDPGVAECRAEARASPEMRLLQRERVMGNTTNEARVAAEREALEQRLLTDCLRRRGLTRGGGVEPVRRPALF